jgi:hypothetical protein
MRLMAFSLTTPQVQARTKTVTRRAGYGWLALKPGQRVQAVEKGMGLKKGETVNRLAVLRIVDVRLEPLIAIDQADVSAEGFPEMTPHEFIAFFCRTHRGTQPTDEVVRVQFEYADQAETGEAARA